ncbi:hypothetical protein KOI35_35640 [Actinoplanes bogorensis]|uniref:Uncharacterized protein n=1 Tax=Paractinoplanes bogorensis TaxID=1610840 RepID=A0ABS5YZI4_9ACTN|nr:hypothetical protein [Actinoplanes bogorensis]MBU2668857.1 hypothetical protein [Actinoplanes bogorensis]
MRHYFAVVDDDHDVKDPVTLIRVVEGAGPAGITRLNGDVAWARTELLGQIERGEVPYALREVTAKAALGLRERWARKIPFRYSVLVRDDDPADQPTGVLREWDATGSDHVYAEVYTREGRWESSTVRHDIERSSNIFNRIVPSDSSTVHRFIESLDRQ